MGLKAIIFDVDGTLAETEEAHRRAFNQAFAEAERPWHWSAQDYGALLTTTGGRERIARYMAEIGIEPDPAAVAAMHVRKNAIYAELVAAGAIAPRPGILRLLHQSLNEGVALAIATTTSRANLDALLHHVLEPEAPSWFSVIVAGEDVFAKKPDPEVYQRVLSQLALEPADCIAIEDSQAGLAAARACGIATVITPSHYTAWQDFSGAALVCDSLDGHVDIARLESLNACSTQEPARQRQPAQPQ
jgi:HAD superfamily hydrolase (TIGR01509 family)